MSFPANPQNGDLYEEYGTTYRYDSSLNVWALHITSINIDVPAGDDSADAQFFNFPTGDYDNLTNDYGKLGEEIPTNIYYDFATIPKFKRTQIDLGDDSNI